MPPTTQLETTEKILKAAETAFLSGGFRETSLDEVAAAAGVTKPTVFSHFGSKQGLLLALVESHVSNNSHAISSSLTASGDTAEDLLRFGTMFLGKILSKTEMKWRRLAMAELAENPEIGKACFKAGPARLLSFFSHFLEQEAAAGRISCSEPDVAAEQFIGMLIGLQPMRETTGHTVPNKAKQRKICEDAVTTFMAAYANRK